MDNYLKHQQFIFLEIFATMDAYIQASDHMFVIFAINLSPLAVIWLNTGNQYKNELQGVWEQDIVRYREIFHRR